MSGISIARMIRSGTGVGPGICRKWRPGRREAFCGMTRNSFGRECWEALVELIVFAESTLEVPAAPVLRRRGALIPECAAAVKPQCCRRAKACEMPQAFA